MSTHDVWLGDTVGGIGLPVTDEADARYVIKTPGDLSLVNAAYSGFSSVDDAFVFAQANGYKGVFIPGGSYAFSAPIVITQDDFVVRGLAMPLLTYTGSGPAVIIGASGDTISGVQLSNLEIQYDGSSSSRAGLLAYTPRGMYLENITITDLRTTEGVTTSIGFKILTDALTNAADVVLENCYTDSCYYGVYFTGTQKVNGCRITGGQYKGKNKEAGSRSIFIENGQHNLFQHVTCVWSETGLYIGVDDATHDTGGQVMLHVHFEDVTTGVYVGAGSAGHYGLLKKVGSFTLLSDNGSDNIWMERPTANLSVNSFGGFWRIPAPVDSYDNGGAAMGVFEFVGSSGGFIDLDLTDFIPAGTTYIAFQVVELSGGQVQMRKVGEGGSATLTLNRFYTFQLVNNKVEVWHFDTASLAMMLFAYAR